MASTNATTLGEIMETDVVTVRPDATVRAALGALTGRHIGGAPVVDPAGQVLGVISLWDLIGVPADRAVAEVMTPHVVAMAPDRSVAEAARLMAHDDIHRVLVLEDGNLVGLVTAMSLVRHLAAAAD
jgi:CBS domain-containing protein